MIVQEYVITDMDRKRIEAMIQSLRSHGEPYGGHVRALERQLERAGIVAAGEVPPDTVTMNSRVVARDLDSGERLTFTLVYHGQSAMFDHKLSVLTSLGARFLGAKVGDTVEWAVPRGRRRLKVESILYQPEAAGDFEH